MTQEWFESADLEKKSAQTKSEIQPDQPGDFGYCRDRTTSKPRNSYLT